MSALGEKFEDKDLDDMMASIDTSGSGSVRWWLRSGWPVLARCLHVCFCQRCRLNACCLQVSFEDFQACIVGTNE